MIFPPLRATICLPTYNERENIEPMLRALVAILRDGDRVLVIDDASPDGTGTLAESLGAELGGVDVIHREQKAGLGPAYIAGFRRALAGGAELVVQIDCDFSHDPAVVPELIAAAEAGADVVLGSRYVPGGAIPNWTPLRRIVSRFGNLYARAWLQSPIHDMTGGFRCYRRRVIEAIDLDAIHARGYAFQVELAYRVRRGGFRVVEVPITFRDRVRGVSKMSPAIMFEASWKVPLLRLRALTGRL
jgi:dolichol-phosphate mannosyltransferase